MYVAIRDFTVLWLGYEDVIEGVKDLGLKSFELFINRDLRGDLYRDMGETVSSNFDISTKAQRREFVKKIESEGIKVCAILVGNDFAREDVEADIKWIVEACEAASDIGVKVVRINSAMKVEEGVSWKKYVDRTVKCIREIIKRTRELDVSLAIENHGRIGNKREFIQSILEDVNSERVGLTLDTGNFYWYGYPLEEVYEIIDSFAPYVKHTHVKNLSFSEERRKVMREPGENWPNSAAPIYEGDIDHKRVIASLKRAGYDEDLTIEDESLGKYPSYSRLGIVKKDIEHIKGLI